MEKNELEIVFKRILNKCVLETEYDKENFKYIPAHLIPYIVEDLLFEVDLRHGIY